MNKRIEGMARLYMKNALEKRGVKIPVEARHDTEKLLALYDHNRGLCSCMV